MDVDRLTLVTLAVLFLVALSAGSVGCSNDNSCTSDSECFAGETCQSGKCVKTNQTLPDATTGEDTARSDTSPTPDSCTKTTWYADDDGDGFGDEDDSKMACKKPQGHVDNKQDCDDGEEKRHPDATETCNGVDDDCDDSVDNLPGGKSCSCSTGEKVKCIRQNGVCAGATVRCEDGSVPTCGKAEFDSDYESGAEETCDNQDNDCDGTEDEGVTQKCALQKGVCNGATVSCASGMFPPCTKREYGSTYEQKEMSDDDKDNDCDGVTDNYVDTVQFGTSNTDDWARDLAFDPASGDIYVSYGRGDAAEVARYDREGNQRWSKPGPDPGIPGGVDFDASQVYGSGQSTDSTPDKYYLEKKAYATGNKMWDRKADATDATHLIDVAVNSQNGDVYAVGFAKGSAGSGGRDIFLAKWNKSGENQWFEMVGGPKNEKAYAVTVDSSNGDIYVAARTASPKIDGVKNPNGSGGGLSGVVMRYDSAGDKKWLDIFGSPTTDSAVGVAYDSQRKAVYVSGDTLGRFGGRTKPGGFDGFLVRYSRKGKRKWVRLFGNGSTNDSLFRVAVDESTGAVYTAGKSEGDFYRDPNTGGFDIATLKFSAKGVRKWTKLEGTPADEAVFDIVVDEQTSDYYLAGWTEGSLPGCCERGQRDAFWMRRKD